VQNILSSRVLLKNLKIKIYGTIIFSVVLYGCETWSLTLREERRPRVFENRALRRIFRPKRDEVSREWMKLHNEELNDLYSSPNIVRVIKSRIIRSTAHVARMGEKRGLCRILVGKPEVKTADTRLSCAAYYVPLIFRIIIHQISKCHYRSAKCQIPARPHAHSCCAAAVHSI
jgi:hypothetical protein